MTIKDLKPGSHIHLMGICGTAMASLAGLLKDRGFHVSGSDLNPYPPMSTQIENLGITIKKGYQAENLNPQPDFVVIGNVISKNNPEAEEVVRLNIPFTSLPKAMGEFIIDQRTCVCVSGTHGKTTTTSLMTWVADVAGKKPGYMIGGIPKNFNQSFRNPESDLFVIEGDEYDTAFFDKVPKFTHYRPTYAILTSVEFDHADIYRDLDHVKEAFQKLIELVPSHGALIYHASDKNIQSILKALKAPSLSYGIQSGDLQGEIINTAQDLTHFKVKFKGEDWGEYQIPLSGEYNVLNALSVIATSFLLKIDQSDVKKAFLTFQGVKRRQEVLGEPRGVLVIEDFAHHPTAVKETLKGIKAKYPNRKIWAVFEPRSATSRRKVFQKDYAKAFQMADQTIIAEAFDQSKIQEKDRFSSHELIDDIKNLGQQARVYEKVDDIVHDISKEANPGDLVLIMSNGGFDGIYQKLMAALG